MPPLDEEFETLFVQEDVSSFITWAICLNSACLLRESKRLITFN